MSRQEKLRNLFTAFEEAYPLTSILHTTMFSSEAKRFQKEFPNLYFKKMNVVISETGQKEYSFLVSHIRR